MVIFGFIVPPQVSASKDALDLFSPDELLNSLDIELQLLLAQRGVFNHPQEIAVDKSHVRLVQVVGPCPNHVFDCFVD
jgi:hypothetical protein